MALVRGLILLLWCASALATDVPATVKWTGAAGSLHGSPEAACQSYVVEGATYTSVFQMNSSQYQCRFTLTASGGTVVPGISSAQYTCPYGGTLTMGNICAGAPDCTAGVKVGNSGSGYSGSGSTPNSLCRGGCAFSNGSSCVGSAGGWNCWGPFVGLGRGCDGGDTNVGDPTPPAQCPAGQCPIAINGNIVCGACAPGTTTTTTGTTSTTTGPAGGAPTGGGTSTTTTTCDGDSCTTTTTTEPAGGGTGTTTTTTEPMDDFCNQHPEALQCRMRDEYCTEHPEALMCQEQHVSGGAQCDTAPTCTGDPALCAITRQTWETRCVLGKESIVKDIPDESKFTVDQAAMDRATNKDGTYDMDVSTAFTAARQSYISYTASCPVPTSIEFRGQTYAMPTEIVCQIGVFVRLLVQIVAYMAVLAVLQKGTS